MRRRRALPAGGCEERDDRRVDGDTAMTWKCSAMLESSGVSSIQAGMRRRGELQYCDGVERHSAGGREDNR